MGLSSSLQEAMASDTVPAEDLEEAAKWHWVEDDDEKVVFVGNKAKSLSYYKKGGGSNAGLHLMSMMKSQGSSPPKVGKVVERKADDLDARFVEATESIESAIENLDESGGSLTGPIIKVDREGTKVAKSATKLKMMAVPRHIASGEFKKAILDFKVRMKDLNSAFGEVLKAAHGYGIRFD